MRFHFKHLSLVLMILSSLCVYTARAHDYQQENYLYLLNIRTFVHISDLNIQTGKITQSQIEVSCTSDVPFSALILTPSTECPNVMAYVVQDESGLYSTKYLHYLYDVPVKARYKEGWMDDDEYEYGIVVGFNVSLTIDQSWIWADLDPALRDEWEITGEIVEIQKEDVLKNTVWTEERLDREIESGELVDFFLIKLKISHVPNPKNIIAFWLPTTLIFLLFIFSLLFLRDLSDALRVSLTSMFFCVGFLSYFREATPPIVTKKELIIIIEISLFLIFSIVSIYWNRKSRKTKRRG